MPPSQIPPEISKSLSISQDVQKRMVKSTPQLDHAISNSKNNGIPPIAVAPAQGSMLSILCQMINAKSILEIGTLGGYSTIWFATAVPGAHVTSIEFNSKHRDVARENVKGLDVDIRLGAALEVLPKIAEEKKVFDFVFIDADWDEQRDYFDWAVKLTRKGGVIFVDNVLRQLADDEGAKKGQELIEFVSQDERVQPTLIPWLALHKSKVDEIVDGFILAIVK